MFDPMTIVALGDKLPRSAVQSRKQGGANVSYVDGHWVISAANRIFGYGMWETEILAMDVVENTETSNSNGKTGWRVGYLCRMQLTIRTKAGGVVRYQDVGSGSGTDYNSLGGAVESAAKEAATDALKRCFRMLGSQFGLALYDKTQAEVTDVNFDVEDARRRIIMHPSATIDEAREATSAVTYDVLKEIYKRVVARSRDGANQVTS